jgi:DNA repair exonuclease SbcCD ATPase subunit
LQCDLADPPADIQEAVIKKLNLVSCDVLVDRDRLREENDRLKAITSRVACIYCGKAYSQEEKEQLVEHITSCEKSPMVQMVKGMESKVVDYMDLMDDEFLRIKALTDSDEIKGLCDRAMASIEQKEPVIKQRDDAIRERDILKAELVTLETAVTDWKRSYQQLEGFKVVLNGICDIVYEFPNHTNENVSVAVQRIKDERDRLRASLAPVKVALEKAEKGLDKCARTLITLEQQNGYSTPVPPNIAIQAMIAITDALTAIKEVVL